MGSIAEVWIKYLIAPKMNEDHSYVKTYFNIFQKNIPTPQEKKKKQNKNQKEP